jgi:hypothetical protein
VSEDRADLSNYLARWYPERCEGGIDLAAGVGVDDLDLQSHGAGGRFHVSQHGHDVGGPPNAANDTAVPIPTGLNV